MISDFERLNNLIIITNYMQRVRKNNFQDYLDIIKILFDEDKIKSEEDYKTLNNNDINNAIKEVIKNEKFLNILKENTKLELNKLI
jgi:hypothetical protein